jgi:hypothetical protein
MQNGQYEINVHRSLRLRVNKRKTEIDQLHLVSRIQDSN